MEHSSKKSFLRLAYLVLGYTIIVIMWGAFVRATGSGAGCGEHWPLCNGEVIPRSPSMSRMIEFSHRLSSGLSLLFVAALVVRARKIFAAGHQIRNAAYWSLGFILGEALVGAMLVLLQLVAGNDSILRAVVIALHLVNTFLLLYWLAKVAFLSRREFIPGHETMPIEINAASVKRAKFNISLCMIAFVFTGAAGAIVALGDTLFPASSLAEGMAQDFSTTAHFLIKLRIWHPVIAVFATSYIALQAIFLPRVFVGLMSKSSCKMVMLLTVCQLLGGFLNWYLLAPVWMQLVHLMMADVTWIAICFWFFGVSQFQSRNQVEGVSA